MTKDAWYAKFKTFLPAWFFENEGLQAAVLRGISAALESLDGDIKAHLDDTFITRARGEALAAHAAERDVEKVDGEQDRQYAVRVQNISNKSNHPAIKSIVDKLLIVGECSIKEDYESSMFFSRGAFFSRGDIITVEVMNAFSIVVDKQLHEPYSHFSREYFFGRECFMGTTESPLQLFELIKAAVDREKAFGVPYRIIERLE
jgi:hypothetical protein